MVQGASVQDALKFLADAERGRQLSLPPQPAPSGGDGGDPLHPFPGTSYYTTPQPHSLDVPARGIGGGGMPPFGIGIHHPVHKMRDNQGRCNWLGDDDSTFGGARTAVPAVGGVGISDGASSTGGCGSAAYAISDPGYVTVPASGGDTHVALVDATTASSSDVLNGADAL